MKKLIIFTIVSALSLTVAETMAATDTGDLEVRANVIETCRVTSTSNVDFGNYDPTAPNPNIAGQGFGRLRCTKGTTAAIYIVRDNIMSDGTDSLPYELYSDAARTSAFPTELADALPYTALTNAVEQIDIYGAIPAREDVQAGIYVDQVTFTVEY